MSQQPEDPDPRAHPAVRNYTLVCLAALLGVVVVLVARGAGWLAMLPLLAGSVAVTACWSVGPALVVLCAAGLLLAQIRTRTGTLIAGLPDNLPLDVFLAGALLAYTVAHFRLQSLLRTVFPPDPRRRSIKDRKGTHIQTGQADKPDRPRPPGSVGTDELPRLGTLIVLATGLAAVVWMSLMNAQPPLGLDRREWTAIAIIWAVALVTAIGGAWAAWRRMSGASADEAMLYLQDQFWRQTRREQSRINRWLVWRRLLRQRAEQRKGKP